MMSLFAYQRAVTRAFRRMDVRSRSCLLLFGAILIQSAAAFTAQAQTNLRSSFPGRRVGGATRGECSARLIAHLVPSSSVYAAGDAGLLGILEGPSNSPRPIQVSFQPEQGATSAGSPSPSTLTLPAAGAGIVLFSRPSGQQPLRWESSYLCDSQTETGADDPLSFVSAGSPPALSLLINDTTAEDGAVQQALQKLRKACGGSVSRAEVASSFGLTDVITDAWPAQLPVRCPG